MRLLVVGSGYVGLVSGASFAELGNDVVCIDKDVGKIEALRQGRIPIYEPGLSEMVVRNTESGRLSFETSLEGLTSGADAVFIAVGTPSRPSDGEADLSGVVAVAKEIARTAGERIVVVTKSTVPVGTGDRIEEMMRSVRPDLDFAVVSNPEFLREGTALSDFMLPDRVVVGTDCPRARKLMETLYKPLADKGSHVLVMERRGAEMTKYASNAFLATKIAFVNEMADLCEATGADISEVAKGMGLDTRIGPQFLHAGPGYGGSCFPKDTTALLSTARNHAVTLRLVESTISSNDARKRSMAVRVKEAAGGSLYGKTIAVLGLTFKPDTDDMREAPSIPLVHVLRDDGAEVRVYDPEGMDQARKMMDEVHFARDAYDCAAGADIVVLMTEWGEFRGLDFERLGTTVRNKVFVDLRNAMPVDELVAAGFSVHGIGRPAVISSEKSVSRVPKLVQGGGRATRAAVGRSPA
jgi:UDPglucose 6-dehydrogenase